MIKIGTINSQAPDRFENEVQKKAYHFLQGQGIYFVRVDTDEAITMEDCILINEKLDVEIVKTLFLCNRQQTSFYLYVTTADRPFSSKDFSKSLGISRLSFASGESMRERLGVKIGAATVFGLLVDRDRSIQLVIDQAVLSREWYGCSDGTTTCYLKARTADLIPRLLDFTAHEPIVLPDAAQASGQ